MQIHAVTLPVLAIGDAETSVVSVEWRLYASPPPQLSAHQPIALLQAAHPQLFHTASRPSAGFASATLAMADGVTYYSCVTARDEASLYALGVPVHASHSIAIAALNGVLVAKGSGGSGDTSSARGRQALKLGWQTAGVVLFTPAGLPAGPDGRLSMDGGTTDDTHGLAAVVVDAVEPAAA